jgi:hypothetical protein
MALEASFIIAIVICVPLEIAFVIRLMYEVKKIKKIRQRDAS